MLGQPSEQGRDEEKEGMGGQGAISTVSRIE